ncbi:hypothetical protein ACQ4PT_021924 [Festuca glaucescens]
MAPRCRGPLSPTGFPGVRFRPSGNFTTEIKATDRCHWLGTFDSKEEAARAYDVAAWQLGRPHSDKNFLDIESLVEAELVAPEPRLVSCEEKRRHQLAMERLAITEADECAMAQWRRDHPEDMLA